jgi:hypothetical protein
MRISVVSSETTLIKSHPAAEKAERKGRATHQEGTGRQRYVSCECSSASRGAITRRSKDSETHLEFDTLSASRLRRRLLYPLVKCDRVKSSRPAEQSAIGALFPGIVAIVIVIAAVELLHCIEDDAQNMIQSQNPNRLRNRALLSAISASNDDTCVSATF